MVLMEKKHPLLYSERNKPTPLYPFLLDEEDAVGGQNIMSNNF